MMRYYLGIFVLFFVFSIALTAQDVHFQNSEPSIAVLEADQETNPDAAYTINSKTNYIINETNKAITLTWMRTVNDLPEGWTSQICDPNSCWGSETGSKSFELGANDSALIKVQFNTFNILGFGTVEIHFYAPSDSLEKNGTAVFNAEVWGAGIDEIVIEEMEPSVEVYPNPVVNVLNVKLENYNQIQSIEVYNLIGKLVKRYFVDDPTAIQELDLFDLDEGMYFVGLLDYKGQLIDTKRFSKVRN